jgi:hypothetical protein
MPMEKRISNIAKYISNYERNMPVDKDNYIRGLYDGLELALSELEMRDPVYKGRIRLKDKVSSIVKGVV